jgi:hypothetical protein
MLSGPSPTDAMWRPQDGHEPYATTLLEAQTRGREGLPKVGGMFDTANGQRHKEDALDAVAGHSAIQSGISTVSSAALGARLGKRFGLPGRVMGAAALAPVGTALGAVAGAAFSVPAATTHAFQGATGVKGIDPNIVNAGSGALLGSLGALGPGSAAARIGRGAAGMLVGGTAGLAAGPTGRWLREKTSQEVQETAMIQARNTQRGGAPGLAGRAMKTAESQESHAYPTARSGALLGAGGGGLAGAVMGGLAGWFRDEKPHEALIGAGVGALAGAGIGAIGGGLSGGVEGLVRDQLDARDMGFRSHPLGTAQAGAMVGAPLGALYGGFAGAAGGPPGIAMGALAGGAMGALDGGVGGLMRGGLREYMEKDSAKFDALDSLMSGIGELVGKAPHLAPKGIDAQANAMHAAGDFDGLQGLYRQLRTSVDDAANSRAQAQATAESAARRTETDRSLANPGNNYAQNQFHKVLFNHLRDIGPVPLALGGLGVALIDKPLEEILKPTAMTLGNELQDQVFSITERSNLEDVAALEFTKALAKGTGDTVTAVGGNLANAGMYGAQQLAGRAMFPGVLKNDPYLSSSSPDQRQLLSDAYNSMLQVAPNVALNPHARANFLRTVQQTGAGPDYATIGALARTEKDVRSAQPWSGR